MNLNATLLAAALALASFAASADDKKPVTNPDVTQADQPSQRMNRDGTLMKNADSRGMDRKDLAMTDEMVLRHLHHANLEEIKAGQLAQSKASAAAVKDYGRTLVQDHQQADKHVLTMADKMHVDIKKTTDMSDMDHSKMDHSKMDRSQTSDMDHDKMKMHQAKMDQLQKMTGKEFDQTFLTMMVNGHDHVIEMVKNAQANAKDDLKAMLDQMMPTLERHKQIAQDLLKNTGDTASAR